MRKPLPYVAEIASLLYFLAGCLFFGILLALWQMLVRILLYGLLRFVEWLL